MRRMLTLATAAVTLAGAVAVSGPAAAQRYNRDRNNHGDAVAAGVLGFALGAAVAGNGDSQYRQGYYAPRGRAYGYYRAPPRAYAYGYGAPRRCVVERRYDPYYGRTIRYERCW